MLRLSTPSDIPALKSLYNECFPGETDFCDRYFENVFPKCRALIYGDSSISAAAHIINAEIVINGVVLKGMYLYAVSTRKNMRGRGFASKLMQSAEAVAIAESADILFLITENDSLFEFYKRFGYKKRLLCSTVQTKANRTELRGEIRPISAKDILTLYNSRVKNRVLRSERDIEVIQRVYGAKFKGLYDNCGRLLSCCIGSAEGTVYTAYEALGSAEDIISLCNACASANNCTGLNITAPPQVFENKYIGCAKFVSDRAKKLADSDFYADLLFN